MISIDYLILVRSSLTPSRSRFMMVLSCSALVWASWDLSFTLSQRSLVLSSSSVVWKRKRDIPTTFNNVLRIETEWRKVFHCKKSRVFFLLTSPCACLMRDMASNSNSSFSLTRGLEGNNEKHFYNTHHIKKYKNQSKITRVVQNTTNT